MAPRRQRGKKLTYFGEINERFLHALYQHPDLLMLHSPGGCMYTMAAAIDYLRSVPTKICATGACFSAAVPILAMAKTRLATPLTRFMVHPGKVMMEAERDINNIKVEHDELALLEQLYVDVLAGRTTKGAKWWEKRIAESHYFDAEEALEVGLIDRIDG